MEEQEQKTSSVSLEEVISTMGKLADAIKIIGEKQDKIGEGFTDYKKVINKDLESLRREAGKNQSESGKKDEKTDEEDKKNEKKSENLEAKLEEIKKNIRLADKLRISDAKDEVMRIKGVLTAEDEIEIFKIAKKADTDADFADYLENYLAHVREKAKQDRQKKKEEAEKLLADEKQKEEENKKLEQAGKLKTSPNAEKPSGTVDTNPTQQKLIQRRQELIAEGKQNTEEFKQIHVQLTNLAFPPNFEKKETIVTNG